MAQLSLPRHPSIEHLKGQARALQRRIREGDPDAVALLAEHHPRAAALDGATLKLAEAQLVVARQYGFTTWPRLREYVDVVTRHSRSPHEVAVADDGPDRMIVLGSLSYGGDALANHAAAADLLRQHPAYSAASIAAACTAGDAGALARLLDADPKAVNATTGPFAWEPLLYVAYSRVPDGPGRSSLDCARLLLERGADPDAAYLWDGYYPFTGLTGAFGLGEDFRNQPPHEHSLTLARLLLEAGADPNDTQGLYNCTFLPGNDHLRLLFEFGLGRRSDGPWFSRLGPDHLPPIGKHLEDQLLWAAARNFGERVQLLLDHGVDPDARGMHPSHGGLSAHQLATSKGNVEVAAMLERAGATVTPLDPVGRLVAAAVAGDRATVEALRADDATLLDHARAARPAAVMAAAEMDRPDAVRLLAALGWDVSATGMYGDTALHNAAFSGNVAMIDVLLELGADPTVEDGRFQSTPLGWALHAHNDEAAARLSP